MMEALRELTAVSDAVEDELHRVEKEEEEEKEDLSAVQKAAKRWHTEREAS